jgi:hypothetical protein
MPIMMDRLSEELILVLLCTVCITKSISRQRNDN